MKKLFLLLILALPMTSIYAAETKEELGEKRSTECKLTRNDPFTKPELREINEKDLIKKDNAVNG